MAKQELLSGASYYQYYFFAVVTSSIFAVYHYFWGNEYIYYTTASATAFILTIIVVRALGKDSQYLRSAALLAVIATVLATCYFLGIRGTAWLFPLVIGIFFNYTNRRALLMSLVLVIAGLALASKRVELELVVRMFFPLALTIGFAYLYRVTIEKEQQKLEKEANEDYLTGIRNRRSFQDWLQRAMTHHEGSKNCLAVFYLDVDNFKLINDTYGHEFGDQVLKEISRRLVGSVRQTDSVSRVNDSQFARIAGDEFVIATTNIECEHHVHIIAERLRKAVNRPLSIDGVEFKPSTSIGVAVYHREQASAEEILRDADAAMYRSKEQGKNRITYFDEALAGQIQQKQIIARALDEALKTKAFYLNVMPIFTMDQQQRHTLCGAEVLIRSHSSSLSQFGPDAYIPVAEECGLIKEIDLYVIDQAFGYLSSVQHLVAEDFVLAINISAKELLNEMFPEQIGAMAGKHGIRPDMVELEITETSLVACDEKIISMLQGIKNKGFKLSLDDFGTGYTAFSQLQHYPVDTLKIDRSFVWGITEENANKQTMVDVILSLANLYGLKIVAEGVENQVQLDYLVRANCDYFQGYYLAKPMPWEDFCQRFLQE